MISISAAVSALSGSLQYWRAYLLSADPMLDIRASPSSEVEILLFGAPQVTLDGDMLVITGCEPGAQVIVEVTGGT